MSDEIEPTDELPSGEAVVVRDRGALNDAVMTLVVVGCMLLLVMLVVVIVVAGQRSPGGI